MKLLKKANTHQLNLKWCQTLKKPKKYTLSFLIWVKQDKLFDSKEEALEEAIKLANITEQHKIEEA
jgi:hypothetical protein